MMTLLDLAFQFLGVLAALFVWLIFRSLRTRAKQEAQRVEERQQRDIAKCIAIEGDLRAWLMMLKLPALEEQRQKQEAPRQLSTVLIEQLLGRSSLRRIRMEDSQPTQGYVGSVPPSDSTATSQTTGQLTRQPL